MPVATGLRSRLRPEAEGLEKEEYHGALDTMIVSRISICEDTVLVLQSAISPDWCILYGSQTSSAHMPRRA